jgi:competence protein ComEC
MRAFEAVPWWGACAALTAVSVGILAGTLIPQAAGGGLAMAVTAGLAVGASKPRFFAPCIAIVVGLGLGLLRGVTAPVPTLPAGLQGVPATIHGEIDSDPEPRGAGYRFALSTDDILLAGEPRPLRMRVQATVYGWPVAYGDRVVLTGRLRPPARFEQFDYRTFLADEGISAILEGAAVAQDSPGGGDPIHRALFLVRQALAAAVDRAVPEPQAAIVLGIVFGYRAALPAALNQQMIASGLIHIVVISGLKVSLVARLVQRGLRPVLRGGAPVAAVALVTAYALLAGASAAALRATAMGGLVVVAGALRREAHVYTSMALTASLMLALKPALAHDVSFQLSFAGTLGIAGLTDPVARRLTIIPGLLRDPFAATVAAELATWPLMLANFHQVSLIGPLANALVLPLLPAMISVGGLGALLGTILPAVAWPILQVAGLLASWDMRVISTAAAVPLAALTAPYFPSEWLAAGMVINGAALAALKLRVFFWQRRVWLGLLGGAVLVSILLLTRPDGRVHIYALDVGTGTAVLVRTPGGHQLLVDGGPDPDRFAQAVGRVLPPTARQLDAWIVTGGRLAEIGAAPTVLARFAVDRLLVLDPDPWTPTVRSLVQAATAKGIPVTSTADAILDDGVRLLPLTDSGGWVIEAGRAAVSVVPPGLTLDYARTQAVIFGDGGPASLLGAAPRIAVIQVDAKDHAGGPARALLRALRDGTVLRTDRLGTVELVLQGGAVTAVEG